MRPCDRCGKPVENIETHCAKCVAYQQEHTLPQSETGNASTESEQPRDWGMDFVVVVACVSATLGGAAIGWLEYGAEGSFGGAVSGFLLAALLTRVLVAWY